MGNSSSATVSNITTDVSKNILKALQTSQTDVSVQQQIVGKCDTNVIQTLSKAYTDCLINRYDHWSTDDLIKVCSVYTSLCKMSNIDLDSNLNMTNLTTATDSVKQKVSTAVSNTLSQYGGDESNQYITNITDTMNETTTKIVSQLNSDTNIKQTVDLDAVHGEFISMDTSLDIITKTLQSTESFQSNVIKISNIITQTADNANTAYTTLLILFGIVALAGLLISIIMTLKRSSGMHDFFMRMLPAFTWFILSVLVTVIHILAKPGYVSYKDVNGDKHLSRSKLFFALMGYYVGFFLIILIVYKIKQRNKMIY